jgi:hypothetical protein
VGWGTGMVLNGFKGRSDRLRELQQAVTAAP